jgi:hypothetical protein
MNNAAHFAPKVTKAPDSHGWIMNDGWHQTPPRELIPGADRSFLIVKIAFQSIHAIELATSDFRLVVHNGLAGTPEALGILGNATFEHLEFIQVASRESVYLRWRGRDSDDLPAP